MTNKALYAIIGLTIIAFLALFGGYFAGADLARTQNAQDAAVTDAL